MSTDTLNLESAATQDAPAAPPVDSPLDERFFVMWQPNVGGRWFVFPLDDGSQATSRTLAEAEAMLTVAKRHVAKHSKFNRLAAASLRIASSPAEEL